MIYEEETALLRKGLFAVQTEVGLGHREEVYHRAMAHWLDQQGVPYVSKPPPCAAAGRHCRANMGLDRVHVTRIIYDTHQTGYGTEVVEALLRTGLRNQGVRFSQFPIAASTFQGCKLGDSPLDCWVVDNSLLFVFTALFDDNRFNISRGLSHMKSLSIPWGIAANFGRRRLEVAGLCLPIRGTALPSVVHPQTISPSAPPEPVAQNRKKGPLR